MKRVVKRAKKRSIQCAHFFLKIVHTRCKPRLDSCTSIEKIHFSDKTWWKGSVFATQNTDSYSWNSWTNVKNVLVMLKDRFCPSIHWNFVFGLSQFCIVKQKILENDNKRSRFHWHFCFCFCFCFVRQHFLSSSRVWVYIFKLHSKQFTVLYAMRIIFYICEYP